MNKIKKLLTAVLSAILTVGVCLGGVGCNSNGDYDCKNHIHKWGAGTEFEGQGSVETVVKYTCELCKKTATEYVDTENNGVIYRISTDGNAEVCAYIGEATHVRIDSSYRGHPVTRIGAEAFRGSSISGITLPDELFEIGERAFDECYHLRNIIIPETVKFIGDYAFKGCRSLTKIEIPANVSRVGDGAFRLCSELTAVVFFSETTNLGNYVFDDCTKLEGITLPKELSVLGEQLFCDCDSLTYIKIPDGVTLIKMSAFIGCEKLQTIVIGNGVQVIESNVFGGCESLKTIYYEGWEAKWKKISNDSLGQLVDLGVEIYFYRETQPTDDGNYWYANEYGIPVKWEKSI